MATERKSLLLTRGWICARIFERRLRMNLLVRIVAHKLFALSVLVGVGIWFLIIPAFTGELGANPLEKLLHAGAFRAVLLRVPGKCND